MFNEVLRKFGFTWFEVLTLVGIVVVPMALWVFFASQESKAFNRATGASTTTWDAMFTSLRVEGTAK